MSKHPSSLQHHFHTFRQQQEAATLGMWIFLLTEVLFFGGLFLGYALYRTRYTEAFVAASHHLPVFWGTLNTAILISSSLTMVLAVHAARVGHRKSLEKNLLATLVLGIVFLGIKGIEYADKFRHHMVPGQHFAFPEYTGPGPEIFFSFYFAMTGLHALHMIIGMGVLVVLYFMARKGTYTPEYNNPVDVTGLYWHFVDIVWIFLFPLLYLVARH